MVSEGKLPASHFITLDAYLRWRTIAAASPPVSDGPKTSTCSSAVNFWDASCSMRTSHTLISEWNPSSTSLKAALPFTFQEMIRRSSRDSGLLPSGVVVMGAVPLVAVVEVVVAVVVVVVVVVTVVGK